MKNSNIVPDQEIGPTALPERASGRPSAPQCFLGICRVAMA